MPRVPIRRVDLDLDILRTVRIEKPGDLRLTQLLAAGFYEKLPEPSQSHASRPAPGGRNSPGAGGPREPVVYFTQRWTQAAGRRVGTPSLLDER